MKRAFLVLIILATLLTPLQAPAGFWIKQPSVVAYSSSVRDSTHKVAAHEKTRYERMHKNSTAPDHQLPGWPGIVSLICGILGIYPLFGVAAVVFGIVGLNKDRTHRGMALAGLILGGVFLLAEIVLVIALAGM